MSRKRRIEALEHRRREKAPAPNGAARAGRPSDDDEARRRWLHVAKARRSKATHLRAEVLARDLLRLLRKQGELDGMDIEGVRARLRGWRPPLDERAVDRVTARMAYDGEETAEGLVCPPEWREAFEAAEVLLGRYTEAPDEDLARMLVAANDLAEGGGDEDPRERLANHRERLGITEELAILAVGPDVGEITQEEGDRRLSEALADFYYGERGYEVQLQIWRMIDEREEQKP